MIEREGEDKGENLENKVNEGWLKYLWHGIAACQLQMLVKFVMGGIILSFARVMLD